MNGWHWQITDPDDGPLAMPIAEGRIRPGMNTSPAVIVSDMIHAAVHTRWTYVDEVTLGGYSHDGDLTSIYSLADGTSLHATITPEG